ncbi:phage tail sheath family protein [Roseomonas marmotae]|uniref:Phage tail sheath subtilisin-like domain-containing protein n=1 Tax=Roseomonas marmotae TaxID=2768161 RepID=A0ABS3KFG9_9PROT|nr:phage tail sheath subtilisin-like domain-containing protein [Roseomonas marmotae]MBO1076185.1 phage tail sheath subtilisin-like domain-containing protein [Roseomonas marmotae]QTI81779.1 phage tail sheath subtilisin-like domain-containing protein [Roseomonas marmotae]
MPDYTAPGVYIEELDLKPPSIEGVSLSTAGFVGATMRGPTTGRPILVTGPAEFRRRFGGVFPATSPVAAVGELPLAVEGFFANGGKRLYVMRVAPAGTTATQFATQGGLVTRLATGSPATVGATTFRPATLRGLRPGLEVTLRMLRDGVAYSSSPLTIAAGGIDRMTGLVTLSAVIDMTPAGGPPAFAPDSTAVLTNASGVGADGSIATGARPASLTLVAADAGAWADGLVVTAQHEAGARAEYVALIAPTAVDDNKLRLSSTAGFYVDAWVEIDRGAGAAKAYRRVLAVNGPVVTLSGDPMAAGDVDPLPNTGRTLVTVAEFGLTATYETTVERISGLTLAPVPGRGVEAALAARSTLIHVLPGSMPATTDPLTFPSGADGLRFAVSAPGADAAPAAMDIIGTDGGPGARTGLRALEDVEDIAMIAAPGWGDQAVQQTMIDQCEAMRYRIALLDPEATGGAAPTLPQIQTQRLRFDSKYAAVYYPRVTVTTPGGPRAIGPSGHVAGLIARIDAERGVVKTPANEVLRGLLDVETQVNRAEHGVLNPGPNNINVIRNFRDEGRGIRVYGGRMVTSLSDWRYIAVRRLFIFIEKSIERGTQWAVFEPNGPDLWSKLTDSADAFLTRLWRDGALLGNRKEQSFFIACGPETMSQDDVDNGRLIMEIGIAPVKPAEFVIIRISQTASGALVEEA